jgi:hypothetical protein
LTEIKDESLKKAGEAMSDLVIVLISGVILAIIIAITLGLWVASLINRTIREAVNSTSTISTGMAATISRHEKTANQQADMVNQTTITMEELAASSRQTAEKAEAASEMAKNATSLAEDGNVTMSQSIEAMESQKKRFEEISGHILTLSEQTGQIGGVAELLKDLSSQINMLALNAVVEPTRACLSAGRARLNDERSPRSTAGQCAFRRNAWTRARSPASSRRPQRLATAGRSSSRGAYRQGGPQSAVAQTEGVQGSLAGRWPTYRE